jgi:hypothetical protein
MFINKRSLYETEMQSKVDKSKGDGIPFIVNKIVFKILPKTYEDLCA